MKTKFDCQRFVLILTSINRYLKCSHANDDEGCSSLADKTIQCDESWWGLGLKSRAPIEREGTHSELGSRAVCWDGLQRPKKSQRAARVRARGCEC